MLEELGYDGRLEEDGVLDDEGQAVLGPFFSRGGCGRWVNREGGGGRSRGRGWSDGESGGLGEGGGCGVAIKTYQQQISGSQVSIM